MAVQDFDYGWLHGALVESTKDADNFQYGSLWGPILWTAPPAPGGDPEGPLIGGKLTGGGILISGRLVP